MDENINEVEGIETVELENDVLDSEDSKGLGLLGKVVAGGAVAATGVAVGYIIKNKDRIIENHRVRKEAREEVRKAKAVEKHLKALEKLGFGEETESTEK